MCGALRQSLGIVYIKQKDPVGMYFHEKMQNLLVSQSTLKTLREPKENKETHDLKSKLKSQLSTPSIFNAENKKKQRAAKATIFMEVQGAETQKTTLLENIIQSASQSQDMVQQTIQNEMKQQDDTLQRRLEKRKSHMRAMNHNSNGTSLDHLEGSKIQISPESMNEQKQKRAQTVHSDSNLDNPHSICEESFGDESQFQSEFISDEQNTNENIEVPNIEAPHEFKMVVNDPE